MTETVKRLFGTPVFLKNSDEVLGRVSDFVFDTETDAVVALLITTNSIIPLTRAIMLNDILSMSRSAVVIADTNNIKVFDLKKFPGHSVAYFEEFHGREVHSGAETLRQRIRDAVFDTEAGELTDFIISDSGLRRIFHRGKKVDAQDIDEKDGTILVTSNQRRQKSE